MSVAVVNCAAQYYGLAIDVGRQKLYYSDVAWGGVGKVGELSTNGTDHRMLIADDDYNPMGVVIDNVNRFGTVLKKNIRKIWQCIKS